MYSRSRVEIVKCSSGSPVSAKLCLFQWNIFGEEKSKLLDILQVKAEVSEFPGVSTFSLFCKEMMFQFSDL